MSVESLYLVSFLCGISGTFIAIFDLVGCNVDLDVFFQSPNNLDSCLLILAAFRLQPLRVARLSRHHVPRVCRCFYVAESYSSHEKWPEALALYARVENYCQNALQSELEPDLKVRHADTAGSQRNGTGPNLNVTTVRLSTAALHKQRVFIEAILLSCG